MRKRGRGRGVHNRGRGRGRANVTNTVVVESPKMMNYIQIPQRPRQSPSYNRERGFLSKGKDNRMTNLNSNGGILGNLVKAFSMGVDSVDGNGNALSGDYYLHKKFKKMTTTSEFDEPEVNGVLPSDNIPISSTKFLTTLSSNKNLDLKTSQDMHSNGHAPNGVLSSSTIKSTSVYKPKFRMAGAGGDVEENPPQSSTSNSVSVITTSIPSPSPTAQVTGDRRLDRQSLDDRISQIIDKNQSILSTWPEHLSKRLKSQTQNQGQSSVRHYSVSLPPTPSPNHRSGVSSNVMMSGGTTEVTPTINSARAFTFDSRSPSQSPALELGNSPRKKFSFDSLTSYSKYNLNEGGNLQSDRMSGTPELSDSNSAMSSTQFVVPKKRRRLSPSSTTYCGGEVSEMPAKKSNATAAGASSNNFQDVDLTVNVSNCGPSPSGAKVTIRTNGASSHIVQAQAQALDFSSIIENRSRSSGSYLSGLQVLSSSPIKNRGRNMAIIEPTRDVYPLDLNMRTSGNPRGRPPRKGKQVSGNEVDNVAEVSITKVDPSVPLDLNVKNKKVEPERPSVLSLSSSGTTNSFRPNGHTSELAKSDLALTVVTQSNEDNDTEKQLLLQTSMPNPKRPTFLALKPMNPLPKSMPESGILPSPETPRGAKAYNQMYINGHAYTYLGFKISTRSSYTCLFKPQPMFIPQETDPKLSMYSNWQARPKDPKANELNISTNNSSVNGRKSPLFTYVSARGKNSDTLTVNSPDGNSPIIFPPPDSSLSTLTASNLSSPTISPQAAVDLATSSTSSSLSLPSSSTKFISKNYQSESSGLLKPSCPSPMDQGNSSSSSAHSKEDYFSNYAKYKQNSMKNEYISGESSESSSGDESNYLFSKSEYKRRKNTSHSEGDGQLLLRLHSGSNDVKEANQPSSSRSSPDLGRFDNPRVKIMEGGFESNEDYTYIRGRGRGRYVCEACGIRCKKPSMLRKHLKTHTDLRPYTCKLCNFSFKTKGNLTKHQKSKSHHKKCIGLGIHPNSSRSLEMTGPIFDNNNTSDEDDSGDDDDDNDSDSDHLSIDENGQGSPASFVADADHFEKEIAQSLLDLSHLSRFPRNEQQSRENPKHIETSSHKQRSFIPENFRVAGTSNDNSVLNLKSSSKAGIEESEDSKPETFPEAEAPIDLSVKFRKDSQVLSRRANGVVKAMGIVGEAQRWEPEEAFLLNGILNLKKVRNIVVPPDGVPEEAENPDTLPSPPEVKLEKVEPAMATVDADVRHNFEYEIKKGIRPGSSEASDALIIDTSPTSSSPKPVVSSNGAGPSTSTNQNHKARLHQPWLSPQGSTENPIQDPVAKRRERTESMNSCITGESSNSGSTVCKDEIDPGLESNELVTSKTVEVERSASVGASSPTSFSTPFAGLISIKPQAEFRQPTQAFIKDEGKAECNICGKSFTRASQLSLHMNIHFLERPFRCDPCGVSFRTKGHLIKHRRSSSHDCKVYLTEAWGVANEENPRPFKCPDCKIAFRIHGHLAKHLRSKMHIMRMECLGKLPFGIYFEMEKSGLNLNEIDTTDCDMSLVSLQSVAKKIYGDTWMERLTLPIEDPI